MRRWAVPLATSGPGALRLVEFAPAVRLYEQGSSLRAVGRQLDVVDRAAQSALRPDCRRVSGRSRLRQVPGLVRGVLPRLERRGDAAPV